SVWMCPDAVTLSADDPNHRLPPKPYDERNFFTYGMNLALSTPYMGRPDKLDRLGELQPMGFIADGLGPHCSAIPHKRDYTPIARHEGNSVNIGFMDGRVESYGGGEVGCRIGDPQRRDIRWFPPNSTWPGPPR